MRYIRWASYLITFAGLVMTAAGIALDLNPTITLIGMMLVVAGVIKVVVVGVWHGAGGFGAPLAAAEEQVVPARPERTR